MTKGVCYFEEIAKKIFLAWEAEVVCRCAIPFHPFVRDLTDALYWAYRVGIRDAEKKRKRREALKHKRKKSNADTRENTPGNHPQSNRGGQII